MQQICWASGLNEHWGFSLRQPAVDYFLSDTSTMSHLLHDKWAAAYGKRKVSVGGKEELQFVEEELGSSNRSKPREVKRIHVRKSFSVSWCTHELRVRHRGQSDILQPEERFLSQIETWSWTVCNSAMCVLFIELTDTSPQPVPPDHPLGLQLHTLAPHLISSVQAEGLEVSIEIQHITCGTSRLSKSPSAVGKGFRAPAD